MQAGIAGLFGLLIGSFLNVCIFRLPRDLSVVRPRSFCPDCEHPIAWYDNIPLLSYVLCRGRCRHCRVWIPPRYPAVEMLTGGLFYLAVYLYGVTPMGVKLCLFSAILVELTVSDLETLIVPDEFTLGGLALGVITAALVPMPPGLVSLFAGLGADVRLVSVGDSLTGALFTGGVLYAVGWLYTKVRKREGLGLGDVKMIAMVGAFLGLHLTLLVLIIGSIAGSVIGLAYIYALKKDLATYELPYGTFIGATAIVIGFLGDRLV